MTRELTRQQASLAFRFRTRMVSKIKVNFKNSFQDNMSCPVCSSGEEDSQEHLIVCVSLNNHDITMPEYRSLFGNDDNKIAIAIKKLERILNEREDLLS